MLVDDLLSCGAVKFGDFVLTSGKKSRYYVDIKRASSRPEILRRITASFGEKKIKCDKVAGVELGAVPLIVSYSLEYDMPFLIIRKGERDHGMKSRIEGDLKPGEKVLLLEDVITSGGSVLRAIDMLEEAGAKVKAVLSVVDREEGGTEKVSERCDYHPLVRARDLLARADME